MKPDWKDAPEWAKFLAQDANGQWYWHEKAPKSGRIIWVSGGAVESAMPDAYPEWKKSLESRP